MKQRTVKEHEEVNVHIPKKVLYPILRGLLIIPVVVLPLIEILRNGNQIHNELSFGSLLFSLGTAIYVMGIGYLTLCFMAWENVWEK